MISLARCGCIFLLFTFHSASEFAIFYAGCIAAFADKEPAYLALPNVKEFLAHQFEKSFFVFHNTRQYTEKFPGEEDEQFRAFVFDADGAKARAAVTALFGAPFFDRVVLNMGLVKPAELTTMAPRVTPAPQPGVTTPAATNPDQAWNKALFYASKLSWTGLGLSKERGAAGGGGGRKLLGDVPNPQLPPTMFDSDDCFFAIGRNNGIQLSEVVCDRPAAEGELSVGVPVIVVGTGRIWERSCGGWGWLAKIKHPSHPNKEFWVREDALIVFQQDAANCDGMLVGVVPEPPLTTAPPPTTLPIGTTLATGTAGVSSRADALLATEWALVFVAFVLVSCMS